MGVEYRVLGPLEVLVEGRIVDVGPPRHRGVLVLLIAHANTVVPAHHLIEALWGDGPPSSAGNLVQGAVSELRKALGKDAITTRGTGYALQGGAGVARPAPVRTAGAGGERRARRRAPRTRPRRSWRRRSPCGEARRWQTSPTSGSCGRSPARLDELRLLALERRLEAEIGRGRHADVLADLRELVRRASAARAGPRAADAGPLPLRPTGRSARGLPPQHEPSWSSSSASSPGPSLQELEGRILRHDPDAASRDSRRANRVLRVAPA